MKPSLVKLAEAIAFIVEAIFWILCGACLGWALMSYADVGYADEDDDETLIHWNLGTNDSIPKTKVIDDPYKKDCDCGKDDNEQ